MARGAVPAGPARASSQAAAPTRFTPPSPAAAGGMQPARLSATGLRSANNPRCALALALEIIERECVCVCVCLDCRARRT
jgi:hypothetical protein